MKKLLLLLLLSTFVPLGGEAAGGKDVFHSLASYDIQSAQTHYDSWTSNTPEDALLKKVAAGYFSLLYGDFHGCSRQVDEVVELIKNADAVNPKVAIYTDRTVGLLHYLQGNLDSAYHYYWPALLLARETYGVNSVIYFDQLSLVIQLFEAQGKWTVAEEMLVTQLGYSKKIYGKKHPKTIETIAHLGHLNTLMARFDAAQGYFDECNKLLDESNFNRTTTHAWSLFYQANFYLTKGNFTVAESLNKQGLKIIDQTAQGYHPAKALALLLEAKIYIAMNDLREAGLRLSELMTYQKKHLGETHISFVNSLIALADVLIRSGHIAESQPILGEIEEIIESGAQNEHIAYCDLLVLKAKSLASTDVDLANSTFLQAIVLFEERYGKNHYYLAQALSAHANFLYTNDQLKLALAAEEQALEIRTSLFDFYHPDYTASIFSLAKIHLKANNINEAANYLKKGAENYIIQYNKYFSFLSEYEKGQFYTRTNEFFDLYYYFALFESPEDQRQYWINQAFNYRLLTKALLFQSVKNLKEAVHELDDSQLNEAYILWIKTKENLSKLNKLDQRFTAQASNQKDSLLALANELEKKISLKVAISKNAQKESMQWNWQTVADQLGDDEMAMEMVRIRAFDRVKGSFTDSVRYVCLALNNQMNAGPTSVVMMDGNAMEEKHLLSYRNLIKFKLEDTRSYGIYIRPILDQLKGHMRKEIFFSPDGVYNQISLNTLLNTTSGLYFIDEYQLHILSSLKDLAGSQENQHTDNNNKYFFFGYPVYEHHPVYGATEKAKKIVTKKSTQERGIHSQIRNMIGLGAEITMLPGTLEEVKAASNIVEKYVEHEMITGVAATEASIKDLRSPALVHIATHGFFLSGEETAFKPLISDDYSKIIMSNAYINPLFNSGLMFTGSAHAYDSLVIQNELEAIAKGNAYEDGIMTSYEAMNIDLRNTRLVVLSACETGLGKVKSGEGVYGLQRAFQTAGAEAVVISLWKVSDEATKELMTLFYQNYMSGLDAGSAFTKAQQALRAKFKSPYYWGAFVFVGIPPKTDVSVYN